MTLPAIADATALGVRLGRTLAGDDLTRAQATLDDVSALARKESGDSERWVSEDRVTATAPQDVVAVVLSAARRLFTNPDGYASEQAGDYSYRLPAEALKGGVFTDAETAILESYRGTAGLWSQSMTGSESTSSTVYVDVVGSEPMPLLQRDWP